MANVKSGGRLAAATVLLLALLVVPAHAGAPSGDANSAGKKKFVAQGSVIAPTLGLVTLMEWSMTCPSLPQSQGVSGYIFEVPGKFADGKSLAEVIPNSVTVTGDFQLWFFDAGCNAAPCCEHDFAIVPKGARFLYVATYADPATNFTLTITKP